MKLTSEQLLEYKAAHKHIVDVAEKYLLIKEIDCGDIGVYDITPDIVEITNATDERTDWYDNPVITIRHYKIPIEYFAQDETEWYSDAKARIEQEKEDERKREEEARAEYKKQQQKDHERQERQQYLKLKDKYGE
jgi:hypothetical protein